MTSFFPCGECDALAKRVMATVSLHGYKPFKPFAGIWVGEAPTGFDPWSGSWTYGTSFVVGDIVKMVYTRTAGINPYPDGDEFIAMYICTADQPSPSDAPADDTDHFTFWDGDLETGGTDPHRLDVVPVGATNYPVGTFYSGATLMNTGVRNRVEVPISDPTFSDETIWETYLRVRRTYFDDSNPKRYADWTEVTEWEGMDAAEMGSHSPGSGSCTRSYTKGRYGAARSTLGTDDLHPVVSPSIGTVYETFFYPNVPDTDDFALTALDITETSVTFIFKKYHLVGSAYELVAAVTQTITLTNEITQADAETEAQSLIDGVDFADLSWGQSATLAINSDGSTSTTLAGGVTEVQGTNYLVPDTIAATKGKGTGIVFGSSYCLRDQPRAHPELDTCETVEGGCGGVVTIDPPDFDGDQVIEPNCSCAP